MRLKFNFGFQAVVRNFSLMVFTYHSDKFLPAFSRTTAYINMKNYIAPDINKSTKLGKTLNVPLKKVG